MLKKAWSSLKGRPGRLEELRRRDQAGTSALGMGRRAGGWPQSPLTLWHPSDPDLGSPGKIQLYLNFTETMDNIFSVNMPHAKFETYLY